MTSRANQLASVLTGTPLDGFRNKIINGNFDIWQRATSQSVGGYGSADRWLFYFGTGSGVVSRQAFDLGQSDVPGNPRFFCRHAISVLSTAGIGTALGQRIEDVRTLAGRTATLTFYARAEYEQLIAARAVQDFGTGGAPSVFVETPVAPFTVGTNWQKFTATVNIPSIAGKTLGDANDHLRIDIGRPAADTIGGYLDVARVSLVEGDATAETDPFAPRHIQQELALCQRYFAKSYNLDDAPGISTVAGMIIGRAQGANVLDIPVRLPVVMRSNPTISLYGLSGSTGSWRDFTANSDRGAVSAGIGTSWFYAASNDGGLASGSRVGVHYTASAEL